MTNRKTRTSNRPASKSRRNRCGGGFLSAIPGTAAYKQKKANKAAAEQAAAQRYAAQQALGDARVRVYILEKAIALRESGQNIPRKATNLGSALEVADYRRYAPTNDVNQLRNMLAQAQAHRDQLEAMAA